MLIFILELIGSIAGLFGFYYALISTINFAEEEKDFEMLIGIAATLIFLAAALYPWLN